MTNIPLLFGMIGVVASAILTCGSLVLPKWFVSVGVHELDSVRLGRKSSKNRESSALGILMHLVLSFFFGALFGALMRLGILSLDIFSVFVYYAAVSLVLGGVILPLEGHGFFGWKEGHWISVDVLAMNAVWMFLFWAVAAILI